MAVYGDNYYKGAIQCLLFVTVTVQQCCCNLGNTQTDLPT